MKVMVKVQDAWKIYGKGKVRYAALRGLSLEVREGEMVSIMGPSGSGKTTLLNLIGALDKPTKGKVIVDGKNLEQMSDEQLALFRRKTIGFIFQSFNLIPRLTALENVEVPMIAEGVPREKRIKKALMLLDMLGIANHANHRPSELSGGEQQRVAIARALANDPKLVLADEPTGNLDTKNKEIVMEILRRLNEETGVTIIVVTHDPDVARRTDRIHYIRDGVVIREEVVGG